MATASEGVFFPSNFLSVVADRRYSIARGEKVDFLRGFWKAYPNFEAVRLDDVVTSDSTDVLEGERVIATSGLRTVTNIEIPHRYMS